MKKLKTNKYVIDIFFIGVILSIFGLILFKHNRITDIISGMIIGFGVMYIINSLINKKINNENSEYRKPCKYKLSYAFPGTAVAFLGLIYYSASITSDIIFSILLGIELMQMFDCIINKNK